MKLTCFFLISLLFFIGAVYSTDINVRKLRKHLAGPPEEFYLHELPSPRSSGVFSGHALIPVKFTSENLQQEISIWEKEVPIDTTKYFYLTIFSPIAEELTISLRRPSSNEYKNIFDFIQNFKTDIVQDSKYGTLSNVPSTTYIVYSPEEGPWNLKIEVPSKYLNKYLNKPCAEIQLVTEGEEGIKTFVRDYQKQTVGSTVIIDGFAANIRNVEIDQIHDPEIPVQSISLKKNQIKSSVIQLVKPDKTEEVVEMNDDGFGVDHTEGDGLYAAHFNADQSGYYIARVQIEGVREDGVKFLRTAQHLIKIVDDNIEFNNQVSVHNNDNEIVFSVGVDITDKKVLETTYRAFAQVWGKSEKTGEMIPIAWIGGMTEVDLYQEKYSIPMYLNFAWLKHSGATFPIELRNVWLQESTGFIPVATADLISVPSPSSSILTTLSSVPVPTEITEEMTQGKRPQYLNELKQRAEATSSSGKIALIHGYCAEAPGPFTREDFTDYVVFESFDSNDLADEFARKILNFTKDLTSFGIFAHSQGGQASLHLHANYWSPLENAKAAPGERFRLINSIGTPYLGCSLGGSIANIGDLFGVGCGANHDLTHDGAKLWLSGIPSSARKDVYYYTAQYSTKGLFHYCNMAANAVLSWPNDGCCELKYGQLEYGNSMGNKEGFCHTDTMHWPPECRDSDRNHEVDRVCAR